MVSSKKRAQSSALKIAKRSIGERNAYLLRALCHLNKNQRSSFLRNADKKLIGCIRECIFNALRGNVQLGRGVKERLVRHKTTLRRIAAKRGNWKTKRKLIVQSGGFLPYIIGPILASLHSQIIGL